mgnify:CR=1 FL=1
MLELISLELLCWSSCVGACVFSSYVGARVFTTCVLCSCVPFVYWTHEKRH